ncbi:MAG: sensory box histidine kinase, partial [Candidatus Binatus sp.]|nr:sensory box histidine kinase [Candidatus Binatus sp.]
HELRNPLNALQLTLHALETMLVTGDVPSPEKLVARIGRASVQVRRLGSIIDDLIEVSRISAGRIELDIAEFDLSLMIKKLVTDLAKQKELPISFHGTEKARIVSDRGKIERILNNLLSNAIKFGQGRPVMVSLQADDARVILEVSDNGIGIPPEDLTRIFERFERSAGARGDSGFGVGLWIALRITEALGGNISARSQPAAGSVFRVELPRKSIAGTGERA